jgi:hypothetical protein
MKFQSSLTGDGECDRADEADVLREQREHWRQDHTGAPE